MNTNYENKNESETNDITKNIEIQSLKNECQDIGKVWKKNCPKCGKEQVYGYKCSLDLAIKQNSICKSCRSKKKRKKEIISCENFTRNCPKCGKLLKYSNKSKLKRANKQNSACFGCFVKRRTIVLNSDFYYRNCPKCQSRISYICKTSFYASIRNGCLCRKCASIGINVGRHPSETVRLKMSKSQKGRKHSEETKLKMSGVNNGMYGVHRYGKLNPFSGKKHTEESRHKMRISMLNRIKMIYHGGYLANIGLNENQYFDTLEKEKGWNGIYYGKSHAQHNIKELGYVVDYYEPNLNIVVEYDEPRHYVYDELKEKDVKRMIDIKNHLNCKFYRYNEKKQEFKEY